MAGQLEAMANTLKHRGPDDEGYLVADSGSGRSVPLGGVDCQTDLPPLRGHRGQADLYLAHRRLSIIDTSPRGHQPMASPDGRHWIVFNGEVYNFVELREELRSLGHRFRTGTDTEVVLAAYRTWGLGFLQRFNGMWAFALYDAPAGKLVLARDRFGVKPLYYFHDAGVFAFASETKSLAVLRGASLRADYPQVFDYIMFGWEGREGGTFFEGVRELEPGSVLQYSLSGRTAGINRYYELPVNDECPAYDPAQAAGLAEETAGLLRHAVELRLRSDVRVGACLSGGLDSTAIVCTIDRLMGQESLVQVGERQSLFTAGYRGYSRDETGWARLAAEKTLSDWHLVRPEARELLADIEDLVYQQDMPFVSTSIYAQYRVMKLARERGVTVLLDGQGADELFAGYAQFYTAFFRELSSRGRWSALKGEWLSLDNASVSRGDLLSSLTKAAARSFLPAGIMPGVYRRHRPECAYLTRDFWDQHRHRLGMIGGGNHPGLNGMLRDMMTGRSLKNLLRYEDRNSMRFSIESRTPFADDLPLIERLFRVPGSYKIRHGWSKHLLRMATAGLVPEPIRWRRDKIGFATPEGRWLKEIGPSLLGYLDDRVSAVIDVKGLRRDWQTIMNRQSSEGVTTIWRFLNLAVWARVYGLQL